MLLGTTHSMLRSLRDVPIMRAAMVSLPSLSCCWYTQYVAFTSADLITWHISMNTTVPYRRVGLFLAFGSSNPTRALKGLTKPFQMLWDTRVVHKTTVGEFRPAQCSMLSLVSPVPVSRKQIKRYWRGAGNLIYPVILKGQHAFIEATKQCTTELYTGPTSFSVEA